MPYGLRIITFPSKRQLFRGAVQDYHRSVPSLNRIFKDSMDEKEKELVRVIAHLRKWQFGNLIWNINIVPYWEHWNIGTLGPDPIKKMLRLLHQYHEEG